MTDEPKQLDSGGVPSPIHDIFGLKVVVLVENYPCSDKFSQIALTRETIVEVQKLIESKMPKMLNGFFVTVDHKRTVYLPEIKSFYTPEEIEKLGNEEQKKS